MLRSAATHGATYFSRLPIRFERREPQNGGAGCAVFRFTGNRLILDKKFVCRSRVAG